MQLLELGLKYKVELLAEKCISRLCSSEMSPVDAIKTLHTPFADGQLRAAAFDALVAYVHKNSD